MFNFVKDITVCGTIAVTSIFSQVAPDTVSGWDKVGAIGILVAAVSILIFDKRTAQKELTQEIMLLRDELKETKREVMELRKSNELAVDRLWESHIKYEKEKNKDVE